MTARCMRDKIPKGEYIIRTCLMDRLVQNKLNYKLVEYGQRVKEQKIVDEELERRKRKGIDISQLERQLSNIGDDLKPDIGLINEVEEVQDEDHKRLIHAPLFDSDGEGDIEAHKKKGVRWETNV